MGPDHGPQALQGPNINHLTYSDQSIKAADPDLLFLPLQLISINVTQD